MKITNYLDITLNLNDGSYHPYRKSIEETNCIHVNSDHPPLIIKEIPRSIEKRLSILSLSKNIFQESAVYCEKCLTGCQYKTKLQYQQQQEINQSKSVITNIGEYSSNKLINTFYKIISL